MLKAPRRINYTSLRINTSVTASVLVFSVRNHQNPLIVFCSLMETSLSLSSDSIHNDSRRDRTKCTHSTYALSRFVLLSLDTESGYWSFYAFASCNAKNINILSGL